MVQGQKSEESVCVGGLYTDIYLQNHRKNIIMEGPSNPNCSRNINYLDKIMQDWIRVSY